MWSLLTKLFLLLLAAYAAGILARHFRQSAIVGYLVAGSLVGGFLFNYATIAAVAELGVALLLFSIGLEFSFRQLAALGRRLLVGGAIQVGATLAAGSLLAALFMPPAAAVVVGSCAALSSTAIVLRVLLDHAQMDAARGRMALGILLVQDLAVVPLVLLVGLMGEGGSPVQAAISVAKTLAAAGGLALVFYLLFYRAIPWLLKREGLFANRELTMLLAILSAMGAIGGAHAVGLSPALGAFLAGMLLAESPFATQIRADVDSIRTLFVVLFFTAIGMLLDLGWLIGHLHLVLPLTLLVFLLKSLIIFVILRSLRMDARVALATGITLGQVGEFAFVLVAAGQESGVVSSDLFAGIVSVTMLSMFMAPYMVAYADPLTTALTARWFRRSADAAADEPSDCGEKALIVGFGPAGKAVVDLLKAMDVTPEIIELNPSALEAAARQGVVLHLGDATQPGVLEHAGVQDAGVVVLTIPDCRTAADTIRLVRSLAPDATVIARARYHRHVPLLEAAGATLVVDEEALVGARLADATQAHWSTSDRHAMACRMVGKMTPNAAADAS